MENLFVAECESAEDLMAVLEEGIRYRQTASHELNERSSRSHSILTVYIDSEVGSPKKVGFKDNTLDFGTIRRPRSETLPFSPRGYSCGGCARLFSMTTVMKRRWLCDTVP